MSTDALEPNMTITIPGAISGDAIISDLLARIEAALERTNSLRGVDCYNGFSARIRIDLQLMDVYPVEVASEIAVGTIDPQKPTHTITLEPDVAGAADDSQPLARPVDPSGITEAPAPKRIYVSRLRGNRPVI